MPAVTPKILGPHIELKKSAADLAKEQDLIDSAFRAGNLSSLKNVSFETLSAARQSFLNGAEYQRGLAVQVIQFKESLTGPEKEHVLEALDPKWAERALELAERQTEFADKIERLLETRHSKGSKLVGAGT